jgi:hypothetical protein
MCVMKLHSGSDLYQAFRARWQQRRREAIELFEDAQLARLIDVMLVEIESMRVEELMQEVGLQDAARLSGYHEATVVRMLERGEIENFGAPGRPRLRVVDLPYKPGHAHPGALRCRINGELAPAAVPPAAAEDAAVLEPVAA